MSSTKAVKNLKFEEDKGLLEYFKKQIDDIAFLKADLKPDTKTKFMELHDDVNLNYQAESLVELWKMMVKNAIIFLKSKDEREEIHDDMAMGTDSLVGFLGEFQKFELLLYGAYDHYRDHIVHVFRVFLLGYRLIRESFGFKNVDISKGLIFSKEEKEAMWCVIALTHDLGYALEGIHKINEKVRNILQEFGIVSVQELGHSYFTQFGNLSDFTLRFLSSDIIKMGENKFAVHLQPKYYQKFMNALSNFKHGVMSSIILMKDLVFFRESDYMMDQYKYLDKDDAKQFMIRREIVRAIASHGCDDIYHLTITNFPFLLTAFDEMQEWGRPRLVDVTKRGNAKTGLKVNEFSQNKIDYEVRFFFETPRPPASEMEKTGDEVKKYFELKKDRWKNVLRSAVGKNRKLEVRFMTVDDTSDNPKSYRLTHLDPAQVIVEMP
jgi:hypothetical protein